ncbi:YdeI/OmpD-associated family protein [Streptomyces liangshanensis]|uniref:YdeI/OmpD-associated family protein n=1 Tax=Streptomyces liangshanensis TaxID=2717324 RepID=UPI0036DDFBF3
MAEEPESVSFESAEDFEAWLVEHQGSVDGIWLRLRKKTPGVVTFDYAQALDVALCHGWIDGQKRKAAEDTHWLQRFTPRRARSKWSKINRDKVEALIASGRMREAGLAEVTRAKADGRWEAAYEGSRTISVPDDLAAALAAEPVAAEFFATLDSRNRFSILHQVHDAKKPETRARRIAKYVAMLAERKKIYS